MSELGQGTFLGRAAGMVGGPPMKPMLTEADIAVLRATIDIGASKLKEGASHMEEAWASMMMYASRIIDIDAGRKQQEAAMESYRQAEVDNLGPAQ